MTLPKALVSSKSQEWMTPPWLIASAVEVFGGRIDTDPATTKRVNRVVNAKTIHTLNDDGLTKQWHGNVWLNPPYGKTKGKSNQGIWSQKMCAEFRHGPMINGLLLVEAHTADKWFGLLWTALRQWDLNRMCFLSPRVRFIDPQTMEEQTSPTQAHVVACFARTLDVSLRFCEIFSRHGKVIVP